MNENNTYIHELVRNDEVLICATDSAIESECGVFVSYASNSWDEVLHAAPGRNHGNRRMGNILAALWTGIQKAKGLLGSEPLDFKVVVRNHDTELMDEFNVSCNAKLSREDGLSLTISLTEAR